MSNFVSTSSPSPTDWRDKIDWPIHRTRVAQLIDIANRTLAPLKFDLQVHGVDLIPTGACIIAPNHISNFDPTAIGLAVYPRQLFFMAKIELYKNPVIAWLVRNYGTFPVYRGKRDEWAFRHAGRILASGQLLCLFPEGTRSRGQVKLSKGKLGTVKLALEHQALVVPAAIAGTQAIAPDFKRPKVTVSLGDPIDFTALAPDLGDLHQLRELTTLLMQRIAAMLPSHMRGFYA